MWEQRYGVLNPTRTASNIRSYTDDDLRMLLNIAVLNRQGMRISKIAGMSEEELQGSVQEATMSPEQTEGQVDALVLSMIDLDEERFEKVFANASLRNGFEGAMIDVVYPFLNRIGVLWLTGTITPVHEHFMTALIRQKIMAAIDGQFAKTNDSAQTWLLFLPKGEHHEISLLFLHYLLKKRGQRVIYLGPDVPQNSVIGLAKSVDVDLVFTISTSSPSPGELDEFLRRLADAFIGKTLAVSGLRWKDYRGSVPTGLRILEDQESVLGFIEAYAGSA
jgi:methanogenic corrinoid protein MtbC1